MKCNFYLVGDEWSREQEKRAAGTFICQQIPCLRLGVGGEVGHLAPPANAPRFDDGDALGDGA